MNIHHRCFPLSIHLFIFLMVSSFLTLGCGQKPSQTIAAIPTHAIAIQTVERYSHPALASFPSRLRAEGNRLVNDNNETIRLRGIMPPDLAVLSLQNRFQKGLVQEIKKTGANAVRIPVHPPHWAANPDYLTQFLDPMVSWTGEEGLYAIIDLHYIGNIADGSGKEMPDLAIHPKQFAQDFWNLLSYRYREVPHVLFEIFNEPAGIEPQVWRDCAEELISLIRHNAAEPLIVVGGVDYAKDLSWVKDHPIRDPNMAYASHIFPSHEKNQWERWFGETAKTKPVLITEWGFIDENRNETQQSYLIGDSVTYGQPLIDAMNESQIGWIACWYDHEWEPPLFRKDQQGYTHWGRFVLDNLKPSNP